MSLPLDAASLHSPNVRLRRAVHRHKPLTRRGIEERLFTFAFSGLVYPQIWEDPLVDLEALTLASGERLVAIASGGCNILSYLTAADIEATGVDLNPAHVALNKLKATAAHVLPDHATFFRFFAGAGSRQNIDVYETLLAPHLDEATRAYWEGRDRLGRRRIGYFQRNIYRRGLLGGFITAGHLLARAHRRDPRRILETRTRAEQIEVFNEEIAPLFEMRHIRWLMEKPASLFGLGIPPAQFAALKGSERRMATVLKARLERLACGFDLADNYFAWQAFGRRYSSDGLGPVPPYLEARSFDKLKARAGKLDIVHGSVTEYLAQMPENSHDAFVLLDAQDWMTNEQLEELWKEILRTGRPGARVIFRTAGDETILPGRLPESMLARFSYDSDRCRALSAKDRSSIYGGFHLYVLNR